MAKKQDGSDDLGENASVWQVARIEVRPDESRQLRLAARSSTPTTGIPFFGNGPLNL